MELNTTNTNIIAQESIMWDLHVVECRGINSFNLRKLGLVNLINVDSNFQLQHYCFRILIFSA